MLIPITYYGDVGGAPPAFSPADISGLKLWLKADSLTGLSDGDPVATWADQSTNGNDLSQSTSGSRPTYKTGIINGLPVVRSDGTKLLERSSGSWPATATVFAVAKLTTVGGAGGYQRLIHGSATGDSYFFFGSLNGYYATFCGNGSNWNDVSANVPGALVTDAFHVLEQVNDGTTLTPLVDGTGQTAKGGSSVVATGLRILEGAGGGAGQSWAGDVAEIIFYDSALSSGDRTSVRNYLASKYGL